MTTTSNDPQFDLFGELINNGLPVKPTAIKRSTQVLPATPSAAAITAAQALPAAIHLGTSSWSFSGWDGLVYSAAYAEAKLARDGLNAYAQHPLFRTVGIDRTFYAPIAEQDYGRYAAQVPEHFRFMV